MGYSGSLANLAPPGDPTANPTSASAGLIDEVLAAGTKSGYAFVYGGLIASGGRNIKYTLAGNPAAVGTTGTNYYFTDQSGVIRQDSTGAASASSSPVGG